MDKITIEVVEGPYCRGCDGVGFFDHDEGGRPYNECEILIEKCYSENDEIEKCPECIAAIKAYKNTHDYEKVEEKIMEYLHAETAFDRDTRRDFAKKLLKALGYKESK